MCSDKKCMRPVASREILCYDDIMFIRKVLHKNKRNRKNYYTYKLVESVRTERGPRQRDIFNLGVDFDLPKEQWKDLANCIEDQLTGQTQLFEYPKRIQSLANKYAKSIIRQQASILAEDEQGIPEYETIDIKSINNEHARSVGAEYIVYETIKELEIDRLLIDLGFTTPQLAASVGVIAGRLIAPGSERSTHYWMQNLTAIDELMGVDFSSISLDSVYKVSDLLLKRKTEIEDHLRQKEDDLFSLKEKIILYDLTNTFFEGAAKSNPKAQYGGKSKERRNDCPLVTLGLVLDVDGFPKKSRIYEGNISEPKTLEEMINGLSEKENSQPGTANPTIVMDAGIASEDNVKWLQKKGYSYIVVSRKKKKEIPPEVNMVVVKKDEKSGSTLVQAGLSRNRETGELELYCHSVDKEKKEEGIRNKFQRRFEAELDKIQKSLSSKYGTKKYDKVIERIGRAKEKYKRVSQQYQVNVEKDMEIGNAKNVTWLKTKKGKDNTSGVYCLRTNREDLDEQQVWDIYTMLSEVEDAFRCMKSHLGLRPIHHHKESRCDGHIFITLIAYHVLHTIRFKLRKMGVRFCWETIRNQLSTHVRITTTMKRKDNKAIHIRKSSRVEPVHQVIYNALGLPHQVGKVVKTVV